MTTEELKPYRPSENLAPPPNWFRGLLQGKTRILLAWAFAIGIGLLARGEPRIPGILLIFAGGTLRYWASGYLRKDIRPAVGGPYAYCRNPLYLGTYLMAVGTAWAAGNVSLLLTASILFALVYHFIILDEETKLHKIFGDAYAKYQAFVPRFFPRPLPAARDVLRQINPEESHHHFSGRLAHQNKAYESYLTAAALVAWVWVAAFLWAKLT